METLQLYSTSTKLFELNRSATEWRAPCAKNRYGRTYFDQFMPTCALGVQFFETQCSPVIVWPDDVLVAVGTERRSAWWSS